MKNAKKEEKRGEEKSCKGFCGHLKTKYMESVGLRVKRQEKRKIKDKVNKTMTSKGWGCQRRNQAKK